MDKQVDSIRRFVDSNINDMVDERRETLEKYEKQFNSIKSVCCKYFEKYDVELEAVSIKAQNVMDKYTDWSKVLIEPASMNDARLFSLESRVHQEEELRIEEFDFLRDMMKKLIYSFEQSNIGNIDGFNSVQALNQNSVNETFNNSPLNLTQNSKHSHSPP